MSKLQLYINISGSELKNVLNQNPDEDVRRLITDVSQALIIPRYDDQEKNVFYLVRYLASGFLIGVISTIINKKPDHVAAWIYVPADLDIAPERLMEVIALVTRKVSAQTISAEDRDELRHEFSEVYPVIADTPGIVPSQGDSYAFRYYGGDLDCELIDLLGVYLYQAAYLPFAGVLMVDAGLGVECAGAPDLTDAPLQRMVTLLPPEEHPDGFKPFLYGRIFTRPMLVALGQQVEIVWKRAGFEDMRQTVDVTTDGQQPECAEASSAKRTITKRAFSVTSLSSRKQLTDDCVITVNGLDISEPQTFTLAELAAAVVTVACEGYEPINQTINLAQSAQNMIQMRERGRVYNFEISAKSSDIGGMIHFEIRSTMPLEGSPIDGYELVDELQEGPTRTNHLVFDGGDQRKQLIHKAVWALCGLICGILLMLVCRCGGSAEQSKPEPLDSDADTIIVAPSPQNAVPAGPEPAPKADEQKADPKAETQAEQPAPAPKATGNRSLAAAVHYLDNNRTWHRDSLEAFPDLRGLYDDLNNINRQRLHDVWGPKLKESRTFSTVADHAKLSMKKKARIPAGRNTYNAPGDKQIRVQSFLFAMDP